MNSNKLHRILESERTLIEVVYGPDPETGQPLVLVGDEIETMARELLNRREAEEPKQLVRHWRAIGGDPECV
jgi:hypothetical protein